MGAGFEQRPWTPTVRRGPIAAEMKSPAPNSVDLPPLLGKIFVFYLTTTIKCLNKYLINNRFAFKFKRIINIAIKSSVGWTHDFLMLVAINFE